MARFVKTEPSNEGEVHVLFACPGCKEPHSPRIAGPQGPFWEWNGDLERATFSPSILVRGDGHKTLCHSFVRDGRIEYLGDCAHDLRGKTVDVPDWDGDWGLGER